MGWWSMEIMGGDEPLDARAELLQMFGASHEDALSFAEPARFRDRFNARVTEVRDALLSSGENHPARRPVLWQVLGHMLLLAGADVDPVALRVCEGCDHDGWATDGDSERAAIIEALRESVITAATAERARAAANSDSARHAREARRAAVDGFLSSLRDDV